jgi:hypothetical protein
VQVLLTSLEQLLLCWAARTGTSEVRGAASSTAEFQAQQQGTRFPYMTSVQP